MFVTSRSSINSISELEQAAIACGLSAVIVPDRNDPNAGSLIIDGSELTLDVIERAHPNPADLSQLVKQMSRPAMVIADRISDAGRDVLRTHGWSWLDRRGHLRVWQPGIRVETPFAGAHSLHREPKRHEGNMWTSVGLEVALHSLIHSTVAVSARAIARETGRSVGATHELIARFIDSGLIGPTTRKPLIPDLFWETSARWPDDGWLALAVPLAEVAERLPAVDLVRVDERAATLGGAKIAAAGDLPARCYVTSAASVRRLRALADRNKPTRALVRVSPIKWIPELAGFEPTDEHPWRIAHPMLCALRLGADMARGREIVEEWGVVPA